MTSIIFELDEAAVIIDALATPARRGKMSEQTAVRSLTEVSACMRAGFPEMQYPWPGYTGRGGIPPIVEAMTNIWSGNVPVLSRHSNNFSLLLVDLMAQANLPLPQQSGHNFSAVESVKFKDTDYAVAPNKLHLIGDGGLLQNANGVDAAARLFRAALHLQTISIYEDASNFGFVTADRTGLVVPLNYAGDDATIAEFRNWMMLGALEVILPLTLTTNGNSFILVVSDRVFKVNDTESYRTFWYMPQKEWDAAQYDEAADLDVLVSPHGLPFLVQCRNSRRQMHRTVYAVEKMFALSVVNSATDEKILQDRVLADILILD